jgi:hypothetical protein
MHTDVAVARSGGGDRIYVVGQFNSDYLRIYVADQTGDADSGTTWTQRVNDTGADPTHIAVVPYQGADKVLAVYQHDGGGTGSDGVRSIVVTSTGDEGEAVLKDYGNLPDFSRPIRISDTDFRIIVRPPSGAMEEWRWNGSAWFEEDANIDPDNETDMYVFSVDTGTDDVERHYKPSGGSWQAELVSDDGEATAHSYPVTQMHEPPQESARIDPRKLVWAYRVVNGANYDLKVGMLDLSQANKCWSSELLTNPGFETGDATGWTNGGGGGVNIGNGCSWCDDPPRTGTNQAYWETDSEPTYYLYQTVDLSSYAGDIDAGNAVISATGWLISNEYQASPPYDEFYMKVIFYDGGSSEITEHTYDTGTVNNPNWGQYGLIQYPIPSGARSVEVRFNTWEACCDGGSADDFSVKVGTPCGASQYDQDSFRARNDNGDESTAIWMAAANTNWTQMVDKNFRLRFLVQETSGISEWDKSFQLVERRDRRLLRGESRCNSQCDRRCGHHPAAGLRDLSPYQ